LAAALTQAQTLRAAGETAAALAALKAAVQRWPAESEPYLRLAEALPPERSREAVAAARKAVRRTPDLLAARHIYAEALLADGRAATACEALAAAIALAPRDAETRYRLGNARLADGRSRDALAAFLRATRLMPGYQEAAIAAAQIWRLLHQNDRATAFLGDFVARYPDSTAARLELAGEATDIAGRLAAARQTGPQGLHKTAAAITAELAAGKAPAAGRIAGCFSLSRIWFELDDPDAAFASLRTGHRLLAVFEPFNRDQPRRLGEAMASRFTTAWLRSGAPSRDPSPVFIVGMPRSGTTLAEQILAAHAQVFGAGERHALGELAHRLGGRRRDSGWAERIAATAPARLDAAAADYLRDLHALAPQAARIVDKMPANFQLLGLAARLFPGARIIHCVRDPRDIGFSIYSRRFEAAHPYAHDLADLGWYIGWQAALMAHWQSVLPIPILKLHLHEWIRDFDRTLRRVLGFLDLPYDPACARFYELDRDIKTASRDQVRRPVNDDGMGRWRPYQRQLLPMITALQQSGLLQGPVGVPPIS